MKKKNHILRFLPYYKKYRGMLAMDLLCALTSTACSIVFPLLVRAITNRAIADFSSITLSWLLPMGLLYMGLAALESAAAYYMQSRGHIMGAMMETDMRSDLFAHLSQLSFAYYSSTKVGQIMSRLTTDLFDITEFAHHGPEELLISSIKIIASFLILMAVNVPLTLIIFLVLPLMMVSTVVFNLRLRRAFRAYRHQVGEINARAEDALLGIRVVQSFANEDIEIEKFNHSNERFLDIKRSQYKAMAGFFTTNRVLNNTMSILVVIAGAVFLSQGRISAGDYASYVLYINTLLQAVNQMVNFSEQYQRGTTGLERFFTVLDTPFDITDAPDARPLETADGTLALENVDFSYQTEGEPKRVLSNLSLTVEKGQRVALVGPSGSGKTTICNLIPRFYDPDAGRILLDGKDIRSFTLKSLRSHIGVVQQDVYLFSGTVFDNIVYGKPGATMAEVVAAAKRAGADEFIAKLPEGYQTYVGERGVKLSGGQKQRISIARVFLKNPPILILDEATSALDNQSEALVQKSLDALAVGRTTLTIAHRLTTIQNADVIWVLTENGLEEHGTHQELLQKKGVYYTLYTQSNHEDRP